MDLVKIGSYIDRKKKKLGIDYKNSLLRNWVRVISQFPNGNVGFVYQMCLCI